MNFTSRIKAKNDPIVDPDSHGDVVILQDPDYVSRLRHLHGIFRFNFRFLGVTTAELGSN